MKRKLVSMTVTAAISAAIMVSLTGCGTKAAATNQVVEMEEETIIATSEEEPESEEAVISDGKEGEEIIATEGDVVFYDKIEPYASYLIENETYESDDLPLTALDDIPVYSYNGFEVGYLKRGASITFDGHNEYSTWLRFANPVSGTDYEYLFIKSEDIPTDKSGYFTADDVKEKVIDLIYMGNEDSTILDTLGSDMEFLEFDIEKTEDINDAGFTIENNIYGKIRGVSDYSATNYQTFFIDCMEDEDNVYCKFYYKDAR